MLTLPPSVRIYLAAEAVDLRKSIDGLSALVRAQGRDLYSGALYVFRGRRADRVKILVWDRGGFVVYYKRLEQGRFRWPEVDEQASEVELSAVQLSMLLSGLELSAVKEPKRWEPARQKELDRDRRM